MKSEKKKTRVRKWEKDRDRGRKERRTQRKRKRLSEGEKKKRKKKRNEIPEYQVLLTKTGVAAGPEERGRNKFLQNRHSYHLERNSFLFNADYQRAGDALCHQLSHRIILMAKGSE